MEGERRVDMMRKTLVVGHKNPDTDSICSAICYANLKRKLTGGIFEPDSRIRRIALCGGAGGEFIPSAAAAGAQLYISADIRYHDFAENAL